MVLWSLGTKSGTKLLSYSFFSATLTSKNECHASYYLRILKMSREKTSSSAEDQNLYDVQETV